MIEIIYLAYISRKHSEYYSSYLVKYFLSIVIKLIRGRKKQRLNIYQATSLLERLLFRCEFQRAIFGEKWEALLQCKRTKAMPIEQAKARLGKVSGPHTGMSRPACEQLSVTNV